VCKFNKCKIPEIGLRIIRYHSFYAWHKEGDYKYLTNQDDDILLEMMQIFNKADLYTKNDDEIKLDLVKTYYDDLIKKYFVSDKIHF
jgi:inositol oxygenase